MTLRFSWIPAFARTTEPGGRLRLAAIAVLLAGIAAASLAGSGTVHAAGTGEAGAEEAEMSAPAAAPEDAAVAAPLVPPAESGTSEASALEEPATDAGASEGSTPEGAAAGGGAASESSAAGGTAETAGAADATTGGTAPGSAAADGAPEPTAAQADATGEAKVEEAEEATAKATASEAATTEAAAAAGNAPGSGAAQAGASQGTVPESSAAQDGAPGTTAIEEDTAGAATAAESATESDAPGTAATAEATTEGSAAASQGAPPQDSAPEAAATGEAATASTAGALDAASAGAPAESVPEEPAPLPEIPVPEIPVPEHASDNEPIKPIPEEPETNAEKVALGRALFHDPRLSKDNSIACVSCHDLASGGDDGRKVSVGVEGKLGPINSPTVFNAGLNFKQFWDGRAKTLEQQIDGPVQSEVELGSLWPEVITKLHAHESYPQRFNALYPDGISRNNVKDALAEFMRTLTTPNGRFDQWLRGDGDALDRQEKKGYALFKHYGCVSCHQGANVGGNMFQVFGVINEYFKKRGNITEADFGRYNVTGNPADRHVFKVPSLRMAALTAPYLHDGNAETLRDAVDAMFEFQLGREAPDEHKDAIVAFIKTLAGDNRELFQ